MVCKTKQQWFESAYDLSSVFILEQLSYEHYEEPWLNINVKWKSPKLYRAIPNVKSEIQFEYFTDNEFVAKLYADKYGLGIVTKVVTLEHAIVYTLNSLGEEYNHIYGLVDQLEYAFDRAIRAKSDYIFTRFGTKVIVPTFTDGIVIQNIIDVPDGELEYDPETHSQQWAHYARKYKSDVYILPK